MARIKQIKKNVIEETIEIGDQVKHPKFGLGTILYKSGSGDRSKAIVVFQEEGQKKLLLKYAKLKKIKEAKPTEEIVEAVSEEEIMKTLDDSVQKKKTKKAAKKQKNDLKHVGKMKDIEEDEDDLIDDEDEDFSDE